MNADEKPTGLGVSEMVTHLEGVWSATVTDMRTADSYYSGTWAVWDRARFPKRPAFHPTFARAKIDQAVNSQVSVVPKVSREPVEGRGKSRIRQADEVEEGLRALLVDGFSREPTPPPKLFFRYLVLYGVAYLGAEWAMDYEDVPAPKRGVEEDEEAYRKRIESWEENRGGWNPIRVRTPHPGRVLAPPYETRPSCVIIKGRRYASELYDLTKRKRRYKGKGVVAYDVEANPYRLVDTLEYYSARYHGLMVKGGEMLFVDTLFHGCQTYQLRYSGWGGEMADEQGGPEHLAVGLLHGLWEALDADAQQKSALMNYAISSGYAQIVADGALELAEQLRDPDAIIDADPKKVGFLAYPEVRQAVYSNMEGTERALEQATFTGAMTGEKISGVDTVGQQLLLQTAQGRKFAVPLLQVGSAFSGMGSDILRMIDMRGKAVSIDGKALSSENIRGVYGISVTFPQIDPLIQNDGRRLGMEEVKMGVKSRRTYQESDMLVDNVSEEGDRLLDEMIDQHPAVIAALVEGRMKARGLGEIADKLQAQRKAQEAQAAMGGRPGGEGEAPAPGSPAPAAPMNGQGGMP